MEAPGALFGDGEGLAFTGGDFANVQLGFIGVNRVGVGVELERTLRGVNHFNGITRFNHAAGWLKSTASVGYGGGWSASRWICRRARIGSRGRSEEHTSELQSRLHLVC